MFVRHFDQFKRLLLVFWEFAEFFGIFNPFFGKVEEISEIIEVAIDAVQKSILPEKLQISLELFDYLILTKPASEPFTLLLGLFNILLALFLAFLELIFE